MKIPFFAYVLTLVVAVLVTAAIMKPSQTPPGNNLLAPTRQTPTTSTAGTQNTGTGTTKSTGSKGGSGGTSISSGFTRAQVAGHGDASSCWTIISGKVYDLTAWVGQHPGGEGAILSICGTDGTAAFDSQHGGQGRPEQILATFFIGSLVN